MRRLVVTLFVAYGLGVWGAPSPEESAPVKRVQLEGVSAFKEETVLDALGIERRVAWRPFHVPKAIPLDEFEAKAEELLRFYYRQGYFEAQVNHELTPEGVGRLEVVEGQVARVSSAEVTPDREPPPDFNLSEKRANLPLRVGLPFVADLYETSAVEVAGWWKEQGFPFAKVTPTAEVDLATHGVAVLYEVEAGERLSFGPTEFQGVVTAEARVLRRALAWKEGELFRQSLVDKTVENLVVLGLFDAVSVQPAAAEGGVLSMQVQVEEGRQRMVRGGAGYSTEEGARLLAGWETLHFLDRTLTLGALGTFSAREYKVGGYLRRPYPWDSKSRFSVDAEGGEREETSFRYQFLDARAGVDQNFGRGFQAGLYARMERVLQFSPDLDLDQALARGVTEVDTLASLILGVTYDRSDDRMDPHRGYRLMISGEPTWVTDTGATFARFVAEGRYYQPVGEERVLAFRVRTGALEGERPDLVPITRRFYAGGPFSVRGYRHQGLGPLSGAGALLGGNALFEASAELRFALPKDLLVLLFADTGNAFTDWSEFRGKNLYTSAGFGLRYQTPAGPLGLDIAFKLKEDPLDPSAFGIHFYIGYAF